jgi:hypothetical protein
VTDEEPIADVAERAGALTGEIPSEILQLGAIRCDVRAQPREHLNTAIHADAVDPHRLATETLYNAMLDARRVGGDVIVRDALDMVGAGAGRNQYRYAAAAIRGLPPGRPAIDDDWALRRILKFPPKRRRVAVGVVAPLVAGAEASSKQVHAIASRLRGKLDKMKRRK